MTQILNQTLLEFPAMPGEPLDRLGFDIGWDHARHGLAPTTSLLQQQAAIAQGWSAGRAAFGQRAQAHSRPLRAWLALRIQAWLEGDPLDPQQMTPQQLSQIMVDRCPVLRMPLGGTARDPCSMRIVRLDESAGHVPGNLALLSRDAAEHIRGIGGLEAARRARRSECTGQAVQGWDAGVWWRVATLRSMVTPLPFHEAARMPLALLPLPGVRLINPIQRLQAAITRSFAGAGFSQRARVLGHWLPEHTLRHDFNLFVGALAPRLLEARGRNEDPSKALEDAWLHERVQRRWTHFALSLGEAAVPSLLERAAMAERLLVPMRRVA
jgi:hypothetical protein